MRTVKFYCLWTVIIGALSAAIFATPASVANSAPEETARFSQSFGLLPQAAPPGSYRQTCKSIKVTGHRLSAMCRAKNSSEKLTVLDDFQLCSGDIWNDDGILGCNKTKAAPAKPDIQILSANAVRVDEISFTVISHFATVPANKISVLVSAKNADDSQAWFYMTPVAQALPADRATLVKIKLPSGKDLYKKTFSLVIDAKNEVEESNEQNNTTGFYEGTDKGNFPSTLPDLYVTGTLYFVGNEYGEPGPSSKAIQKGTTAKISASLAGKCKDDTCTFYFAFAMARTQADDAVAPFGLITSYWGGQQLDAVGNGISLKPGQLSVNLVVPVKLKIGENKLKMEIDPYNKIPEGNKGNNVFVVTIILQP